MSVLDWLFGSAGDLPAGQCMLWRLDLLSLYVAADVVVTLSAMAIPFGIAWYMQRRPGMPRPYRVLAGHSAPSWRRAARCSCALR